MKHRNYVYFQPNDKDPKDDYGDCAVRSFCVVEELEWLEAYDKMSAIAREVQCPFNVKYGFEHIMKTLGYTYYGISNKKGTTRPTVAEFARHNDVTAILVVANHYVAIKNKKYYDTWDSGEKKLYGYWVKQK